LELRGLDRLSETVFPMSSEMVLQLRTQVLNYEVDGCCVVTAEGDYDVCVLHGWLDILIIRFLNESVVLEEHTTHCPATL